MKNQKLLVVLVVIALLLSIFSSVISLIAFNRNFTQDQLLSSIQKVNLDQPPLEEQMLAEDIEEEVAEPLAAAQPAEEQPAAVAVSTQPQAPQVKAAEPQPEQLKTIIMDDSYVDLGLPSGTKWKAKNEEGLLDFDSAIKKYKRDMPTVKQWEELKKQCQWKWHENGYIVTGPNGVSIFLPAEGYRNFSGQTGKVGTFGNYWSRTPKDKVEAWRFGFEPDKFSLATNSRCYGRSVRLVED